MRIRFVAALAMALCLLGASAAQATGLDALQAFAGKWRGKGKVVVRDGRPAERIVCHTSGRVVGSSFTISGRCGGGSQSGTFKIIIRSAGGTGSRSRLSARRLRSC